MDNASTRDHLPETTTQTGKPMRERPFTKLGPRISTPEALQEAVTLVREMDEKLRLPMMTPEYCGLLYDTAMQRMKQIDGLGYRDKDALTEQAWELYSAADDIARDKEEGPTFSREPTSLTSARDAGERSRRLRLK